MLLVFSYKAATITLWIRCLIVADWGRDGVPAPPEGKRMRTANEWSGWTVIVPLKPADRAKRRLSASPTLARAIALDTLAAVTACPSVARILVVTDDAVMATLLRDPRISVVPDQHAPGDDHGDDGDAPLNSAVRGALAQASGHVAVLLGDLPVLDAAELGATLDAARTVRAGVVSDADGTGTTLLTALDVADLEPSFGPGSFARHLAAGAAALPADATVRRDVDTPEHLVAALREGTAPHVSAALTAG